MIAEIIKKNWNQEICDYISKNNYINAINLCEDAISQEPNVSTHYWYLGLALLLNGQETEAQMTWMLRMSEADANELEFYTDELIQILQSEADKRENLAEYSLAWAIIQHIKEINPVDINNILKLCILSIKIELFTGDELIEWRILELLSSELNLNLNSELLLDVLHGVLDTVPWHTSVISFAEACLKHVVDNERYFSIMLNAALVACHRYRTPKFGVKLVKVFLKLEPDNLEALKILTDLLVESANYKEGIEKAKICNSLARDLSDRITTLHLLLKSLMKTGGYCWEEIECKCEELEVALKELIETQPTSWREVSVLRLLTPYFAIPHIKDTPAEFRKIYNGVSDFFQKNIQLIYPEQAKRYLKHYSINKNTINSHRKLKIGYLSYCFKSHSVGWLARWLFQHHDRDNFEIYAYIINYSVVNNGLQEWYCQHANQVRKMGINGLEIAEQIYNDQIDILIDLDSITLDISCQVMALKPAPIQATWLGWDASGIPAVDYFIADPYVLPEQAQDYYTEKIWRLPQTYIAVDGFEVDVPTLRRDELNIPNDAVIFLSAQRGAKRHPKTARLQMKIIKEVPNSYFLIKGFAEEESIKSFFFDIAKEEGVEIERLKFIPNTSLEAIHRANLAIADVVLDTYPYNGATTTLETLWMGIPIVTRVGEQFVARNSYTMMRNAGIEEGIAWSDEEYIEWGIRLGMDANLRQQISWKLKQSRQTAPLWNAKQFTREMEKAYQKMWQIYLESR
ncbi:MAG: O-linked N-acetylglucosamine transferase, SPINDLY family protein [Calothrix sp. FI2-JRJ7]|jgi:predicted O-linked N-acetylglucosamine transferase (SPINDLY family)|nr:O-linked N-acetylglucosamine transferase, SPINDLY family protein [Calothrix sp. FI2-JRJ7]